MVINMADGISKPKLELICSTFLFAHVDEIVVELLCRSAMSAPTISKGGVIFDETHFSRCLGIILSGEVRVDKITPEGKPMKMSRWDRVNALVQRQCSNDGIAMPRC